MFDLCSDRLLEDEDRFSGRNGHRLVEIWDCGNGKQPTYRSGELKEKEIVAWVDEERSANGPIRSGIRVLLSPRPSGGPSSGKLPLSRSTFLSLAQSWRIPSTFVRAIAQKLSVVTQCSVATAASSPKPSPTNSPGAEQRHSERPSQISESARCLLIRGDVDWTWDYTLSLTFDPETHTTYVIVVGLSAVEINLVQSYLVSLTHTASASLLTHPLLIPIVLLDLATDDTASLLKIRAKLLRQIQQQTGMDRFNTLRQINVDGRRNIGLHEKDRQELDLDAVMLRLTCLSDWVAAQRGFVELQRRVVGIVEEMLGEESNEPARGTVIDIFQERLDFVNQSLVAAEGKCQYLEKSIAAQVQTIYSLIGQKDNRLNIAAASASCQIASDSRRIAILTRRDSTDMRIIAAVTLVFLPGTFVATLFSTGLFDWGNGDPTPSPSGGEGSGRTVSKYIWVYFMLTGALTFVVLVGWAIFSWFQNRKMTRQFGFDPEYGEVVEIGVQRRDTDAAVAENRQMRSDSWISREFVKFEKWKDEARGSLRWWSKGKKERTENGTVEELKIA